MPLAREQRVRLARALSWSRSAGWQHDAYPNTWRSTDRQTHIRYDTAEQTLVVDQMRLDQDPLRCRVAMVPVDSPEVALDVLAALGHLPWELTLYHGRHRQADRTGAAEELPGQLDLMTELADMIQRDREAL